MKASAPPISASPTCEKAGVGVFLELIKARLTSLVLLTTLVGFYVGSPGVPDYALMFHALVATGLVASGAAALNQLLEREHDAKMTRTSSRPLPSGRIQPETVLVFGTVCAGGGLLYLVLAVNSLTAALGALTLTLYLVVYTPLKRITPLNTVVGAVPGAFPPLMGWTASHGQATLEGWSLFAILFVWQIPHFLAIAWLYREDYAKAGYAMLPVLDKTGERTRQHVLISTAGLLLVSLVPYVLGLTGNLYLVGAVILSSAFLALAIRFGRELNQTAARQLFFASIIFLPALLTLMVLDRTR